MDQIVRDLMDVSMQLTRKRQTEKFREQAKGLVEDRILDLLMGPSSTESEGRGGDYFRDMLRQGLLDQQQIQVDLPQGDRSGGDFPIGNETILILWSCLVDTSAGRAAQNRGIRADV